MKPSQTIFSETGEEIVKELASIITIPFLRAAVASWGDTITEEEVLSVIRSEKKRLMDEYIKENTVNTGLRNPNQPTVTVEYEGQIYSYRYQKNQYGERVSIALMKEDSESPDAVIIYENGKVEWRWGNLHPEVKMRLFDEIKRQESL